MIFYRDTFLPEEAEYRLSQAVKAVGTTIKVYALHGIDLRDEDITLSESGTSFWWEHNDGKEFVCEKSRDRFNTLIAMPGSKEVRQSRSEEILKLWNEREEQ